MDNAECGDNKECECVENYEDVGGLCQCPVDMTEYLEGEAGAGPDSEAPGCRKGRCTRTAMSKTGNEI